MRKKNMNKSKGQHEFSKQTEVLLQLLILQRMPDNLGGTMLDIPENFSKE